MKKRTFPTILFLAAVSLVISLIIFGVFLLKSTDAVGLTYGVIDLGTESSYSDFLTEKAVAAICDNYDGGGCSVAVKTLDNGDVVAGRNMDMTLSDTPVYIGHTDVENYYETVYVSYVPDFGPDYESCIENGVPGYVSEIVPFIAHDSLNSCGLYMQTNMRMDQKDENGNSVFACEHTNEDAETRISALELPSYITLRCKNVDEAVELINELDIYTLNGIVDWPFSFLLADAEGNCGLIELGCNQVRWIPGCNAQTNFYISDDFADIQKYKQGIGRYDFIKANLDGVASGQDMLALFEKLKYSGIYDADNPYFDVRSEFTGDKDYITNEYLDNEANWNSCKETLALEAARFEGMSEDEKKADGGYWISIYTALVNCSQKSMSLSFFEDYSASYVLDFNVSEADQDIDDYIKIIVPLEIFSILISLSLLYGNSFETRRNSGKMSGRQKIYSVSLVLNMIGNAVDMLSWLLDGNMEHQLLLKASNNLSILFTYVLIGCFAFYLYSILDERAKINQLPFKLFVWGCIVAIVVSFVIFESGGFFIVRNGSYYEGELFSFYSVVNGIFIAAMLIIIANYRKILGWHDLVAIFFYVFVPVLCTLISIKLPELSLGYPAATLAFVVIYVMLQSETSGRLLDERNISEYAASHDMLTGLLSRRAYVDDLKRIESGEEDFVGVLFSDVNGLKYANDKFGHETGDRLIISFAEILEKVFENYDIYRISGDEFVVVMRSVNSGLLNEKASKLSEKLVKDAVPVACFGTEFGSSKNINELIRMAESEMYVEKEKFYKAHPEMKR